MCALNIFPFGGVRARGLNEEAFQLCGDVNWRGLRGVVGGGGGVHKETQRVANCV